MRKPKLPKGSIPLKPQTPNIGIAANYRARLDDIIRRLHDDLSTRIERVYRAQEDEIAFDEAPPPLSEAEIARIRILAEGGDDRLPGAQGPVANLERKGIIRRTFDPEDGHDRWELTVDGERIARKLITPAARLRAVVNNVRTKWLERIEDTAPKLAKYFATTVEKRQSATLKKALKQGGFTVQFKMTPTMRDVYDATIGENVGLIRSIASQHLDDVEGLVMRSVQRGRDLGPLTKELQKRYGLTRKRAAFIALDQNNKASSAMGHARQLDLGLRRGIWRHSHAGKEPRPTHVRMDGKTYELSVGMYDSDPRVKKNVFPGELINCFPGSTLVQFAHNVEKAFRRWFDGDLAEVITSSGKTIRATLNHPVLTTNGWIAIGSLNKGDDIFEIFDERIFPIVPKDNVNSAIPLFSKVFDAVANTGILEVALSANFHGDLAYGNIDVVLPARTLCFGWQPTQSNSSTQFYFANANQPRASQCFLGQLFHAGLRAASGIMRGFGKSLAPNISFSAHPNYIRFTTSSYAPLVGFNVGDYFSSRDIEAITQCQNTQAIIVKPTQIVSTNRKSFRGHVFNLQTADGWYIADGIIAHNCRCFWQPLITGIR